MIMQSEPQRHKSNPLTVSIGILRGQSSGEAEKKRDEFRKKNKAKFIDCKWLKNVTVMGKHQ